MIWLLAILLWLITLQAGEAACTGASPTWTATPDYTSVDTCVTNATQGDTINVQAGDETWNSLLVISKNVQLIGAGAGSTIIRNGLGAYMIQYNPTSAQAGTGVPLFRISGFTFDSNNLGAIQLLNNNLNPPISQLRIDHNTFTDAPSTRDPAGGIWIRGVRGVIDNNTFECSIETPFRMWGSDNGGTWDFANFGQLVWGTAHDNIYIEDNTICQDGGYMISDADEGARYVFRYNNFNGTTPFPWLDLHPSTFGGEVYGNIYAGGDQLITHRGGRLAHFLNQRSGGGSYNVYNNDGCASDSTRVVNHTASFLNRNGATGALSGASHSGGDVCGHPDNALELATATCNGTLGGCEDIKWWLDNTANDGDGGVSAGTAAARPATCTENSFYWQTNQSLTDLTGLVGPDPATPIDGALYRCGASNDWTLYYTPLTYPHALRSGAAPVTPRFNLHLNLRRTSVDNPAPMEGAVCHDC